MEYHLSGVTPALVEDKPGRDSVPAMTRLMVRYDRNAL
jgi:hypothetical protein